MNTHRRQALRDYGLLVGLLALLFWGGIVTLGCVPENVPGGGLVEEQSGVRAAPKGGIIFDVTNTQNNVAQYRLPRYGTLSDGTKAEYAWEVSETEGARVVGPDPNDPDYVIVNIEKDETGPRVVSLQAFYGLGNKTRSAVRNVQVSNE